MRGLLIVALTAVCLIGTSPGVLAEEVAQGDMEKMKTDLKAEKKALKEKSRAQKEAATSQGEMLKSPGQDIGSAGQSMKPAVPDLPAPQAPGAR